MSSLVQDVSAGNKALDPPYFPVGDIGFRLQRLPSAKANVTASQATKLQALVHDVNARIATVSEQILKDSAIWLVAGSSDGVEARVIFHALTSFRVDCLTTDSRTAVGLIELASNGHP